MLHPSAQLIRLRHGQRQAKQVTEKPGGGSITDGCWAGDCCYSRLFHSYYLLHGCKECSPSAPRCCSSSGCCTAHSAFQPEEIRHQGAGQFLGRVIESQAVESLALSGGFLALVAVIELAISAIVLGVGAGGMLQVSLPRAHGFGLLHVLLAGWLPAAQFAVYFTPLSSPRVRHIPAPTRTRMATTLSSGRRNAVGASGAPSSRMWANNVFART